MLTSGRAADTEASPVITGHSIRSPKRTIKVDRSRSEWFGYYAGYSTGFVEDILAGLNVKARSVLLDPWLGSGTTSEVALAQGLRVAGYDVNPAMLVVAKARMLPTVTNIHRSYRAIERAIENDPEWSASNDLLADDPLRQWLKLASARTFRRLEDLILASGRNSIARPVWRSVSQLDSQTAFFYLALFRTLRHFINRFQSSNPTWVKIPDREECIYIPAKRILARYLHEVNALRAAFDSETRVIPASNRQTCRIGLGSSENVPMATDSVDIVVSSPPYCTRIDYVRATLPELALVNFPNGSRLRHLREQMIGTPTISALDHPIQVDWGTTCGHFLNAVRHHPSKASGTYYLQYYLQYFGAMFSSLRELFRVVKAGGHCVLVVQDSFYKDVWNDLPTIVSEMATSVGWNLTRKVDFHVKRTLAGINPGVRSYRSVFSAVESALIFTK